ncbi:Ig-specific serine endopeptidase MIP [Mycoplasmopsis edwardii]|uniref:DUF31 family protein n=1 Tax=Mycoplasmopsis edwardii TaxID=53558 RepID=A0ACD4PJ24_9BACT|nr:DUF31 family protein [Mycoplasmopsis edwardii]WBP84325.1 DUF31 family protein [Mycoplasmopsis edwardii]
MRKKLMFSMLSAVSITSFASLIACSPNKEAPKQPEKNEPETGTQPIETPQPIAKSSLSYEEAKRYIASKQFNELFKVEGERIFEDNYKTTYTKNDFASKAASGEISVTYKGETNLNLSLLNAIPSKSENKVTLIFSYDTDVEKLISYDIDGFKEDLSERFNSNTDENKIDVRKYVNDTQEDRYKVDAKNYYEGLVNNSTRRDLGATEAKINEFNAKAERLHLPNYDMSNLMGMTIPKYDASGNMVGLDMKLSETGKAPSWVDNYRKEAPKNRGLARTITNETYANIAMQTFNFNISNYHISKDESIRNQVTEALKNDEDVSILINMINTESKKNELLDKYNKTKTNPPVVKQILDQAWKALVEENGGDEEKAAVFYTKYIRQQQQKIIDRTANINLTEKTRARLIKKIKDTTDFYELERYGKSESGASGTAWIMDYELTSNGKYPMKWYFATNLHVLDGIDNENLTGFSLARLGKDTPSIFSTLGTVGKDDKFKAFNTQHTESLTRIFDGRDYLTADPVNFMADKQFNKKEYIDIAIFEVDFSKTEFTEEQVKELTNDYANLAPEKKAQFADYDYLTNYEKINHPLRANVDTSSLDSLYILGFPKTQTNTFRDYYLKEYEDADLIKSGKWTFSLWTNASYHWYGSPAPSDDKNRKLAEEGYGLSYNIGYRTFTNKPGITDQFLTFPVTGKAPYVSNDDGKEYVSMNLGYLPRRYIPGGGASGSSVRTKDNKVVAIFHTANEFASTGIAAALRSSGFDYQGLYGGYNLPQYDVIYGTGKDQKNSYRHEMLRRNKGRTWLFKDGFAESNVPNNFKFNK